jgi:hypothetical protein
MKSRVKGIIEQSWVLKRTLEVLRLTRKALRKSQPDVTACVSAIDYELEHLIKKKRVLNCSTSGCSVADDVTRAIETKQQKKEITNEQFVKEMIELTASFKPKWAKKAKGPPKYKRITVAEFEEFQKLKAK